MAVDDKSVKDFEKTYKGIIFGGIDKICSQQAEIIGHVQRMGQYANLESDIPNIGITLNNKIIEMQHIFEKAGLSIYSSKIEDYGPAKINMVGTSYIGSAIIEDLIDLATKGVQNLSAYDQEMSELTDKKAEQIQALTEVSKLRKFFARIRSFFIPIKQEETTLYEQEEMKTVNAHLSDYKGSDNQLWDYNLRDNIVQSIVKKIREEGYHAFGVPGLINECVIPDLQKLGLEDLVPELQRALVEEYKKDLPDPEICQVSQADMYLYVPDFNRNNQENRQVTEQELEELFSKAGQISQRDDETLEGEKAGLGEDGVALGDLVEVDRTVSAAERQGATQAIKEELQPVKENIQTKVQEAEEASL